MRKSNQEALRSLLRLHEDGLTVTQMSELLGHKPDGIRTSLKCMVDAYIDRWIAYRKQWTAVWCVIVAPEDCPKPSKKPNARPTQLRRLEPRNLSEIRFGFVLTNASPTGRY